MSLEIGLDEPTSNHKANTPITSRLMLDNESSQQFWRVIANVSTSRAKNPSKLTGKIRGNHDDLNFRVILVKLLRRGWGWPNLQRWTEFRDVLGHRILHDVRTLLIPNVLLRLWIYGFYRDDLVLHTQAVGGQRSPISMELLVAPNWLKMNVMLAQVSCPSTQHAEVSKVGIWNFLDRSLDITRW